MSRKSPSANDKTPHDELLEEEHDDTVIGVAFRWSLVALLLLCAIAGGAWYWATRPAPAPPLKDSPVSLPEVRQLPPVAIPMVPFVDITTEAGIEFVHENGAFGQKLLPETMGGGCAFLDFDNDGDQDLLLVNSKRWPWDDRPAVGLLTTPNLYRNDGAGKFDEVAVETGLAVSLYGMGVACGDYDNDGKVDLFLSAVGKNRLFHNDGGKFTDVTDSAGVGGSDDEWSTSCGWFDMDNDSDLDLIVCNYVKWSKEYDLAQNFQIRGVGRAYGRPQDFPGSHPYLYRNEGNGKFKEISAEAGMRITNPSSKAPMSKSLGVAFADFDADGLLDVVVANDTVQNFLFHNLGNGKFEEIATIAGIAYDIEGNARGAMGIDIACFRNTKAKGIAIGNFANEMTALYVTQPVGSSVGNVPTFTDEAVSNGLGPATRLELTFGLFFFDCDLDGRPDLLSANGHLEDDINKVQASQFYEQPPRLYWNCGSEYSTEFVPVPEENTGKDLTRPMVGRGSAFADIDGDGDLDVILAGSGQKPRLLRNDQKLGHHWLRLKLNGKTSNRDAIGAEVAITADGITRRQTVMPTRSYLAQVELPVTFGLGNSTKIDSLEVHWPSGKRTTQNDVKVDQLLKITEE